ncbi:MAG: trypsin-like peptidase domain-containing protein [Bacteroidota bacterium]
MRTHLLLLLALVLVGCEQPAQSQERAPQRVDAEQLAEVADANIGATRRTAIVNAVEVVTPAVVSVNVIGVEQVRYRDPFAGDPFFEYFFGRRRDRVVERQVQGLGSGFVISPDGYIVTNDHVAGNATQITVAFPNGDELDAQLIGSDPESDIALLKVDPPSELPYLQFRETDDVVVGEWAIALGNPFGLFEAAEPTVTVGVVSATGRDFAPQQGRVFRDMIQTDAAINRGNSGGPLVNALGEVIGVNSFIVSPQSGGSVGIGFAVPATRVRSIVDELQANGFVDRSFYTGLNVRAMNRRIAAALGLSSARGLIVESVDPGSPAEASGIQPYDVIVSIAEQPVNTAEDAKALFASFGAGESVTVRLLRDGAEQTAALAIARTG